MSYKKEDLDIMARVEKEYGDDLKLDSIFRIKSSGKFNVEVILGFGTNSIKDGYHIGINLDSNKEINNSDRKIFLGPYPLEECKNQFKSWCENIVYLGLIE